VIRVASSVIYTFSRGALSELLQHAADSLLRGGRAARAAGGSFSSSSPIAAMTVFTGRLASEVHLNRAAAGRTFPRRRSRRACKLHEAPDGGLVEVTQMMPRPPIPITATISGSSR
jgi:hypothetical protein